MNLTKVCVGEDGTTDDTEVTPNLLIANNTFTEYSVIAWYFCKKIKDILKCKR